MSHWNPFVEDSKILKVGDAESWMDEAYVGSLSSGTGILNYFIENDK